MQDETTDPCEDITLTHSIFQILLNMTGGDPDLHMPLKRALVRTLHAAQLLDNGRWEVWWTKENMQTAYDHLAAYFLNHPQLRVRTLNVLCKQSSVFEKLSAGERAVTGA